MLQILSDIQEITEESSLTLQPQESNRESSNALDVNIIRKCIYGYISIRTIIDILYKNQINSSFDKFHT